MTRKQRTATAKIRLPKWIRSARRTYRITLPDRRVVYDTQKREAIRRAARYARFWTSRRSADVHVLGDQGQRWFLIAQVGWSATRQSPVLREL